MKVDPGSRLNESELVTWLSLIQAHHGVFAKLESELEREHGMPLAHYTVLLRLSRAPGRALLMGELARKAFLSPSGLTRLVDRLVRDGLVERIPCASDARASYARLTPAGLQKFRAAARTHARGIREHFLARLDEDDRTALAGALSKVAGSTPDPRKPLAVALDHDQAAGGT